jgi:hypothetical protein
MTFTPEKLKELKRDYNKALKNNSESFFFEEQEMLTAYAKYLIEYLDSKFKN